MINESELESLYEEMKNTKYLEKHFGKDFVLNKGKDGRYFTRLPNGKQLRKADKQEFINEIVKYYQREEENKTLRLKDIYDKWIEFKFKYDGISKSSYDRIGEDFDRFFLKNPLAQEMLKVEFEMITEDDLEYFVRDTIVSMKLTAKAWSGFRYLLNGIWLYGLKLSATNLYITKFLDLLAIRPKVLRQRIEREEEQVFTDEEVRLIFEEIEKEGFTPTGYGIILCFYTGMRAGELAGLMWEDVSDDFSTIYVNHMEVLYKGEDGVRNQFEVVNHAKTVAGLRKVIVPDVYKTFFKKLKLKNGTSEYVFVNKDGKRLHARNFSDKLYRLCIKLNIPPKRMHKIRKTVCSKLCDSGVDERLMLKQIGHTDRNTTEKFYHRDRRTEAEKRDILNKVVAY